MILTPAQAAAYAFAAGFQDASTIVAIAQAESGLDTLAVNINTDSHTFPDGHTGPSEDRGILQINNYWHPEVTDAQAFDPAQAFLAGYAISKQGTDYSPWATYQSGAYKRYLTMTYRMLPNALHFSEFQGGYHGTCGETALATAMVCATPPIEDTQEAIDLMLSMTQEMISLGWASSSGSTTTQHLRDEAGRRGFATDSSTFISYQQPLPDSTAFHNLLLSTAGIKPIIIEIANAGVLEGNSVQYHFICVVGITDAGYICNDGDNPNITSHLVTYSWSQIEAAVPCGVLVLEMKTSGGSAMPVPAGWHDNGTTLTDPSGKTVTLGFRQYILDNAWDANDVVVTGDMGVSQVELANTSHGAGDVQFFRYSQLSYTAKEGVFKTWLGSEAAYMRGQISAQNDEIDSLQKQVAALNAQIAALKSQPTTTVDPSVKTALSAAAQLLQPYGAALSDVQNAIKTLP